MPRSRSKSSPPPISVQELQCDDNLSYLITVARVFVVPPSAGYGGRALLFPAGQYFIPRRIAEDKAVREALRQVSLEAKTKAEQTTASMPRYRSAWVSEAEIIAHIAETITGGDLVAAREEFLIAARYGAIEIRARGVFDEGHTIIPPESWWQACWIDLPDRMASGFFFGPHRRWYYREGRRDQVDRLWPVLVEPESRRRGPQPGSSRLAAADRRLFDELEKLILDQSLSPTAAGLKLAENKRVAGVGSPDSRAKRLAGRYLRERRGPSEIR